MINEANKSTILNSRRWPQTDVPPPSAEKNKPFFSKGEKVERAEQLEKLGTESTKYEAEGGGFSDVSMDPGS